MKKLIACCSLFASSLALGQAVPMPESSGQFWIEGRTVTLAYSNLNAPDGISNATMLQGLAKMEADLEALNTTLEVQVDTNVRSTGCGVVGTDTVVVCWQPVAGNSGNFTNVSGGSGTNYWREATVILDNQTAWSSNAAVYAVAMHELMHVLGFGHPEGSGTSVLNGALDLTQLDKDGLIAMYSPTRCTLTYNLTSREIVIPYVTYRGNAYRATIRHDGGTTFSLVTTGTSMYTAASPPQAACQNVAVDANNQGHLPRVNVNGAIYYGDLTLTGNNTLTLSNYGTL